MARSRVITLVGPTHPYTGGIAQHTTRLALELETRGHQVWVESWKSQYPRSLHHGEQKVPDNKPEIGIASRVVEKLAWYSPLSWWLAGRRARSSDAVVVSIPTPWHAIPYLVLKVAIGHCSTLMGIVHNVSPHEKLPGQTWLMRLLLQNLDQVIVHYDAAQRTVEDWGIPQSKVRLCSLPSPWISSHVDVRQNSKKKNGSLTLLFFGSIRPYKGLDLLLEALSHTPKVKLIVAGAFWGNSELYVQQIEKLGIRKRVELRGGYVPASLFPQLFSEADVVVLPYRSGSGSIVSELAFAHGVPVIASSVGAVAEGVVNGLTGLVIPPDDVRALAEAIRQAENREVLERWRKEVSRRGDVNDTLWEDYVGTVIPRFTARGSGRAIGSQTP